ncbi:MAG: hypothetical protein U0P46_12425 [Holophagaceae bacterium]
MKILLASSNQGKLVEFRQLLNDFQIVPWPADAPSLPETGAFFSVSPAAMRENSGSILDPLAIPFDSSIAGAL